MPDSRSWLPFLALELSIADIKEEVAWYYGLSAPELCSQCRERPIVRPRQVAMYLTRLIFGKQASFPAIGRVFGGRDHSTVIHAYRLIPVLAEDDAELQRDIARLLCRINERLRPLAFAEFAPQDPAEGPQAPDQRVIDLSVVLAQPRPPAVTAARQSAPPPPSVVREQAEFLIDEAADLFGIPKETLGFPNGDQYLNYCRQVTVCVADRLLSILAASRVAELCGYRSDAAGSIRLQVSRRPPTEPSWRTDVRALEARVGQRYPDALRA